jgi:hypothetical protein
MTDSNDELTAPDFERDFFWEDLANWFWQGADDAVSPELCLQRLRAFLARYPEPDPAEPRVSDHFKRIAVVRLVEQAANQLAMTMDAVTTARTARES